MATGRFYIGITCKTLAKRWANHVWSARSGQPSCTKFARAIAKYGPEAFRREVICIEPTFGAALAREVDLIAVEKPHFNITAGGQGLAGVKRSAETVAKIANANRGRRWSEEAKGRVKGVPRPCRLTDQGRARLAEASRARIVGAVTRQKIGDAHRGKEIPAEIREKLRIANLGKVMPEETKAKLRTSCTGWHHTEETLAAMRGKSKSPDTKAKMSASAKRRPVRCLNDDREFEHGKQAAIFYGIGKGSVSMVANGLLSHYRGLRFVHIQVSS